MLYKVLFFLQFKMSYRLCMNLFTKINHPVFPQLSYTIIFSVCLRIFQLFIQNIIHFFKCFSFFHLFFYR
jgi:hypothetical protein